MTEVIAVLFQLFGDGTLAIATEPVKMTIEACLAMARDINSSASPSFPFMMVCVPDLSVVGV